MKTVCMLFIALAQPPNSRAPLPDDDPVAWGAVGGLRNTPKLLRSASDPADLREPAPRPAFEREAAGRRCRRRSLAASRSSSLGPRCSEVLRSCSEVSPRAIGRSAGAAWAGSARVPAWPRERSDKVRQRSDKVRQRSDTARRSGRRKPGAAPSIAKYRSGRPVRRDLARTGRNSQVGGTAPGERRPPPKYRQVSRVPVTSRAGRWSPRQAALVGSSHARSGAAGAVAPVGGA